MATWATDFRPTPKNVFFHTLTDQCHPPGFAAWSTPEWAIVSGGQRDRVELVEKKGQGLGLGLIAGGVVGGVLGHQIGSGRGNTAATILGAGAGAYAGNEIEKNSKKSSYWAVAIHMDNGQTRNFTYTNPPPVHEGERVRLLDGAEFENAAKVLVDRRRSRVGPPADSLARWRKDCVIAELTPVLQ